MMLVLVGCVTVVCAESKPDILSDLVEASKSANYANVAEVDYFKALINKLPNHEIEVDEEKLIKLFATRLEQNQAELGELNSYRELAALVYQEKFQKFLQIRVDKFNDLMSVISDGERVSVGFISFNGVAKEAARLSQALVEVNPYLQYTHTDGDLENGTWYGSCKTSTGWTSIDQIYEVDLTGVTKSSKNATGSIDEKLVIEKGEYGNRFKIEIAVNANGEIRIEAEQKAKYVHAGQRYDGPEIEVKIQPSTEYTVSKEFKLGSYFRVKETHDSFKQWVTRDRVDYPAQLSFKIKATEQ